MGSQLCKVVCPAKLKPKKEPSPELLCLQKRFSRVHRQGLEPWTP
nr:MAG TPA: tegument protein [Inoviridae sp.]